MPRTAKRPREAAASGRAPEGAVSDGVGLLANWHASLAEFYLRRIQRYWLYPFDLAQFVSVDQVARSLQEFEVELLADYADMAEELTRIAGKQKRGSRRDYEAHILKAQEDAAAILDQAKAQAERILESARAQVEAAPERSEDETAEPQRKAARA